MSRRTWRWITGISVFVIILAGVTAAVVPDLFIKVTGTVTCPTELRPAGFYVHGAGLDNGFAKWQVEDEAKPNVAKFTHRVALPWLYGWTVDIGCGQNPNDSREWLTNSRVADLYGTSVRIDCSGIPPPKSTSTQYGGKCRKV